MNAAISLEDFKFIFFMEWAHRNLGRLLGVTFVLPALYFTARGKMARKDQWKAFGLACGIGFQVRTLEGPQCEAKSVANSHGSLRSPGLPWLVHGFVGP